MFIWLNRIPLQKTRRTVSSRTGAVKRRPRPRPSVTFCRSST